ncbi:hypothetical protein ACIQVO_17345 [Streptomyces sp. NPDC101062]|uniref:hypothetical protein n=1 Tax=unclassified Streptomyces TaxID=2593676 RepID=UPI0037FCA1A5
MTGLQHATRRIMRGTAALAPRGRLMRAAARTISRRRAILVTLGAGWLGYGALGMLTNPAPARRSSSSTSPAGCR